MLAVVTAAAATVLLGAGFVHTSTRTPAATGVIAVETKLGFESAAAAGTGIVLPAGRILTNNHVIRGATVVQVHLPHTSRRFVARVLGYSPGADVAVLAVRSGQGLQAAPLGRSAGLQLGDPVRAVGNAGGTGSLTTTTGAVIGLGKSITASDDQGASEQLSGLIETSAPLRPGDSGGPLEDRLGRVIGVDTAASHGFVFSSSTGRGFAIPIDRALAVARQIEAGRSSATVHIGPTAFLGVQVARSANVSGGLVEAVVGGSPAARAGLGPGDVIVSLAGRPVASPNALVGVLLRLVPGQTVQVRWQDHQGSAHRGPITPVSGPPQ
jgi:S1-C subfamily serine protease